MNISLQNVDTQNAVITISVDKNDYQVNVDKQLKNYQQNASIPGFRKGKAPMGMIKKQYENALRYDELNKILQKELFQYLENEKVEYLGQPIPAKKESIDWEAEVVDYQFKIGLVPQFDIDLSKASVNYYVINANEEDVTKSIERMQLQQGEAKESETIADSSFFTANVNEVATDEQKITNLEVTIMVSQLKDKAQFVGKNIGDKIQLKAQDIFSDLHQLQHKFGLSHDDAHHFNETLEFEVKTIKTKEPVALDEKFFHSVFPTEEITTEADFRKKIQEELTQEYKKDTDMFFMNDTTDWLMENTQLDLPKEFLIEFFQISGEKQISSEESAQEYEQSKEGIKYQLIERKLVHDNDVKIDMQEIIQHAKETLKNQLAMYGYKDVSEEELNNFATESLKDKNSVQRYNNEVLRVKMLQLFHEKVSKKEQKIDYESFVKMVEEKNHQHI